MIYSDASWIHRLIQHENSSDIGKMGDEAGNRYTASRSNESTQPA